MAYFISHPRPSVLFWIFLSLLFAGCLPVFGGDNTSDDSSRSNADRFQRAVEARDRHSDLIPEIPENRDLRAYLTWKDTFNKLDAKVDIESARLNRKVARRASNPDAVWGKFGKYYDEYKRPDGTFDYKQYLKYVNQSLIDCLQAVSSRGKYYDGLAICPQNRRKALESANRTAHRKLDELAKRQDELAQDLSLQATQQVNLVAQLPQPPKDLSNGVKQYDYLGGITILSKAHLDKGFIILAYEALGGTISHTRLGFPLAVNRNEGAPLLGAMEVDLGNEILRDGKSDGNRVLAVQIVRINTKLPTGLAVEELTSDENTALSEFLGNLKDKEFSGFNGNTPTGATTYKDGKVENLRILVTEFYADKEEKANTQLFQQSIYLPSKPVQPSVLLEPRLFHPTLSESQRQPEFVRATE